MGADVIIVLWTIFLLTLAQHVCVTINYECQNFLFFPQIAWRHRIAVAMEIAHHQEAVSVMLAGQTTTVTNVLLIIIQMAFVQHVCEVEYNLLEVPYLLLITDCSASSNCSGNGNCTASGSCKCATGWAGDTCDHCDTTHYPAGSCDICIEHLRLCISLFSLISYRLLSLIELQWQWGLYIIRKLRV